MLLQLIFLIPICERMVSGVSFVDARLCSAILNLFGQKNHVNGFTLWSGDKSVLSVIPACTGLEFLCLFAAAVIVFPVPSSKKILGMLVGIALLNALNLLRIVSLYFIGIHYPAVFDIFHEEIWGMVLIIASISLFISWIRWAGPAVSRSLDATT
jgi:exosortase H (IPTLxxWG-CTERM-specific)